MSDIQQIKQEICNIGDRLYKRGFSAANDGNITYRLGENEVLCTPTMHCKGFLQPDDICLIDMKGHQLAGRKKRSSEALLHLAVMKARPDVKSVVHCHPPHPTAFAIAREPIPQCVLPEVEHFLGEVPIAPYATPGTQDLADSILPFVKHANVIILANHGTVSYDHTVERAYWWTEVLDAYCRILILAKTLGGISFLGRDKCRELLEQKAGWGFHDARLTDELAGCDVCGHAAFGSTWEEAGVKRRAFVAAPADGTAPPTEENGSASSAGNAEQVVRSFDRDELVREIAERVVAELRGAFK